MADPIHAAPARPDRDALMAEIRPELDPSRHLLVSVISGVTISRLRELAGDPAFPVARAMPNTAVSIGESMTCLAVPPEDAVSGEVVVRLFEAVGVTLLIREEMII